MTFKAVIDESDNTKTILDGSFGDGFRNVLWQPGDAIAVVPSEMDDMTYGQADKFVATIEKAALYSDFDGFVAFSSQYKAFYPYAETVRDSSDCFTFNLPSVQKYVPDSFDPAAAPMVAVANYGETFKFKNLCGVLALKLTGEEAVKSITFTPKYQDDRMINVAGKFKVNPYQTIPEISVLGRGTGSVTLKCDTPVKLNSNTPTVFHIVLPPGVYHRFNVSITTANDRVMIKHGVKPLEIRRSEVQPASTMTYVETLPIDLSADGTANCYIVTDPGLYSFDASVIGNGPYGLISGAGFHTDTPFISPYSVQILWEEEKDIIEDISLQDGKVVFLATGNEGNALVVVMNESNDIIWSWHIWATDKPQELLYVNRTGNYTMLDRNLGAVETYSTTENINGYCYQWGRKDPIRPGRHDSYYHDGGTSIENTITNPSYIFVNSWDENAHWHIDKNTQLWTRNQKTIYDPCPPGYKVPHKDAWLGFSYNETYGENNVQTDIKFAGEYIYGVGTYLYYDNYNTTFFPVGTSIRHGRDWGNHGDWCEMWFTESVGGDYANNFYLAYYSYNDARLGLDGSQPKNNAFHVRCMKDDNHAASYKPFVKISIVKDQHSAGATVEAEIVNQGQSRITDQGFVWGTTEDLTIETASYKSLGTASSKYSYSITGLESATRYYVRAYAVNEHGISYSEPMSFKTTWSGTAYDLSHGGTANCYIVPVEYAEYSFNASVRGNSTLPVGNIASVEVLWETDMFAVMAGGEENVVKVGDIIDKVYLQDGYVHLLLPMEPKSGNALVAVKDEYENVLWSWHIWVVDFDPAETQKKYDSGLVMMDRNLGATSVIPTSFPDYSAYGLYYQWGRKDPLVNAAYAPSDAFELYGNEFSDVHNRIEYSYSHPTVFYDDITWSDDATLWQNEKTINDPCPVGWRVPDIMVWDGLYGVGDCPAYNYMRISPPYSDSDTYYPFAGVGDWTSIGGLDCDGYYWSTNRGEVFRLWDCYCNTVWELNTGNKASVRCMKDEKVPVTGGGKDYIIDDEYEW